MKAVWHNAILAESNDVIFIEGHCYFPPDTVHRQLLRPCATHTFCSWKGKASYYDVVVDEAVNPAAAWYYPEPKAKAEHIKNYVAFWHGVDVVDSSGLPLTTGAT